MFVITKCPLSCFLSLRSSEFSCLLLSITFFVLKTDKVSCSLVHFIIQSLHYALLAWLWLGSHDFVWMSFFHITPPKLIKYAAASSVLNMLSYLLFWLFMTLSVYFKCGYCAQGCLGSCICVPLCHGNTEVQRCWIFSAFGRSSVYETLTQILSLSESDREMNLSAI